MSDEIRDFAMPRLGMAMTEGTISGWRRRVGERIVAGETLLTVENNKTEIDVESPWSGVVIDLLAGDGDTVPVMKPIARILIDAPL